MICGLFSASPRIGELASSISPCIASLGCKLAVAAGFAASLRLEFVFLARGQKPLREIAFILLSI